jgi:endoglucanase
MVNRCIKRVVAWEFLLSVGVHSMLSFSLTKIPYKSCVLKIFLQSDAQMAEIRVQAEQEANALLNSGARVGGELSIETLERAYASIEAHLLKAAAMSQSSSPPISEPALRRLLQDTAAVAATAVDGIAVDEANPAAVDSAPLAYSPSAVQPTPAQGLANSDLKADTYFDADAASTLKSGFISTSDTGACAAICLFRSDCFAWSIKSGGGCYLRGKKYTTSAQNGATSGVMTVPAWKPPPTPSPKPLAKGAGKYASALRLSARFLAAQRSGKLPPNNLVPWRRSAQENDPVPGGWYEAANELKPNFPMSVSVSYIAWAMLTFPRAFSSADASSNYLSQLRVANDYLLGCYDEKTKKYIGLIGDPENENKFWGRADQNPNPRPAFTFTSSMSASDLFSNAAAAWAASSLVFKKTDAKYAKTLVSKAQSIYALAKKKEGKYSDYFKDVTYTTFPSTDYLDNQAWAAGWLYRATKVKSYLTDAESFWQRSYGKDNTRADVFPNWDSLWAPSAALMRQIGRSGVNIPGKEMYDTYFERKFVPSWVSANGTNTITRTPKGMAYPAWNIYANLQYSTTAAMVMLQDAAGNKEVAVRKSELSFAKKQVDYALGSNGRSYIVGFGANWPKNVRHGGASCPDRDASNPKCDMNTLYMRAENGQQLTGALTGGPAGRKRNPSNPDFWQDIRTDLATNEPSVTINAGLAGALAGCFALNP